MQLVRLADVRAATERIRGVAVRTPVVPCGFGVSHCPPPLLVKPESLQVTGAFKIRGAANKIAKLSAAERACGVVTHSSGNHAQAVAYAARCAGVRAVVVMPEGAPRSKIEATQALGAEVVLVAAVDRAARAARLAALHGYVPVPPYDDPDVIAGQGTVGLEIVADVPDVDVVLVPVSGGGLISGIATAVKALRPGAAIVGVEPELAADARDSLRRRERVSWAAKDTSQTIADGLRVPMVGALPWAHIEAYVDDIITVTEHEILDAVRFLAARARLVAEPSGATAAAAYLFHAEQLPPGRTVAVLSGGNLDPGTYADILCGRDENLLTRPPQR